MLAWRLGRPAAPNGGQRWDQGVIPPPSPPPRDSLASGDASSEVSAHVRANRFRARRQRETEEVGQSLVEFSLILFPLFFILHGIIQFGFIFNTYVTMTNAARDAARSGTVYVYDRTISKSANDLARNNSILAQVKSSMNGLSQAAPRFTNGGTWTQSGSTF